MRFKPRLSHWSFACVAAVGLVAMQSGFVTRAADAGPQEQVHNSARGAALFAQNCASCHGTDAKGLLEQHAPNLTDEHWLFAGADLENFKILPSDVARIIAHGIRSGDPQSVEAAHMPGRDDPQSPTHGLSDGDIEDMIVYLQFLMGQDVDHVVARRGRAIYHGSGGCFDCHSDDALGNSAIGATNLTKANLYLYGTTPEALRTTLRKGRAGVMPGYADKLSPDDIKALTHYVYGLASAYDF